MSSPPKIPLQLQRQRQQRHTKLMKMITSYELNRQQKAKLEKIKSHTMMEINLRFLRSEINRNYKFPKSNKSMEMLNHSKEKSYLEMEDNDEEEQNRVLKSELEQTIETRGKSKKRNGEYFAYDLKSQNGSKFEKQVKEIEFKAYSTKILSLQQSRRVHSLGSEKPRQKAGDDLLIHRHNPIKNSNERFAKSPPSLIQTKSMKSIKAIKSISQTRRSSKQLLTLQQSILKSPAHNINNSKNLLIDSRKLKLPQINALSGNSRSLKKLTPIQHEKLKTQKIYEQEDIQYAIGKKLVTETTDSGKKAMKGVEKYLKQLQAEKQKLTLNSQQNRLMKKDKDHEKRRLNFDVIKTTKHSLARQVQ